MVSPLWIVTSREKKSVYSNSRPLSGCWLAGSMWSTPTVTVCGAGGGADSSASEEPAEETSVNAARLPSAIARDQALWTDMHTPRWTCPDPSPAGPRIKAPYKETLTSSEVSGAGATRARVLAPPFETDRSDLRRFVVSPAADPRVNVHRRVP